MNIQKTNKEITQMLLAQEKSLKVKLHSFYKLYVKNQQAPTESIRGVLGNRIKAIVREAVEKSYFYGIDLVRQKVQEKSPNKVFFISGEDIQNVQNITEKMNEQFWTTTSKLHRREHEFMITLGMTPELVKKKEFDTEAAYIGIAALMVFSGFNNSIVSKTRQVLEQNVR